MTEVLPFILGGAAIFMLGVAWGLVLPAVVRRPRKMSEVDKAVERLRNFLERR